MKVVVQEWIVPERGQLISISKDRDQLSATVNELAVKKTDDEYAEIAEPYGEPEEIEISDDSVFAEMVKTRTIFLNDDEMQVIYDAVNANG